MHDYNNTSAWKPMFSFLAMAIFLIAFVFITNIYAEQQGRGQGQVASPQQAGTLTDQGKITALIEKELDLGRGEGLLSKCPRRGGGSRGGGYGGSRGHGSWSSWSVRSIPSGGGGWSDSDSKRISELDKIMDEFKKTPSERGGSSQTGWSKVKPEKSEVSDKELLDGIEGIFCR